MESFRQDHQETERQLRQLEIALREGNASGARDVFQQLKTDLLRHFVLEEQALFPVLSQYRSMILLEVEHDDLLALQDQLETAIGQDDGLEALSAFEAYALQLRGHAKEEEEKIFPMAQSLLTPEEWAWVERRWRELSAQADLALVRPDPQFAVHPAALLSQPEKPIAYRTLYEKPQASVQQISLKSGQSLARHWAGQDQYLLVISGSGMFEANGRTVALEPGLGLALDSRLPFSIAATGDLSILTFKTWPYPHFAKA